MSTIGTGPAFATPLPSNRSPARVTTPSPASVRAPGPDADRFGLPGRTSPPDGDVAPRRGLPFALAAALPGRPRLVDAGPAGPPAAAVQARQAAAAVSAQLADGTLVLRGSHGAAALEAAVGRASRGLLALHAEFVR